MGTRHPNKTGHGSVGLVQAINGRYPSWLGAVLSKGAGWIGSNVFSRLLLSGHFISNFLRCWVFGILLAARALFTLWFICVDTGVRWGFVTLGLR